MVKDHKLREEAKQVVGDAEWGKDGNWGWAWNICFIFLENHELLIPADTYRMYLYYDSMYIYIYIYVIFIYIYIHIDYAMIHLYFKFCQVSGSWGKIPLVFEK